MNICMPSPTNISTTRKILCDIANEIPYRHTGYLLYIFCGIGKIIRV